MALIDADEFERGKLLAAAEWKRNREPKIAAAFAELRLDRCGFGMTPRGRTCWAQVGAVRIGLSFGIESGEYERSFVIRAPQAPHRPKP